MPGSRADTTATGPTPPRPLPAKRLGSWAGDLVKKSLDLEVNSKVYASSMAGSKISEMAASVGVAPSTVRYYERIGLVPSPPRTQSGYRQYSADAEARLRFIVRGKRLGLSLEHIAELLSVWDGTNCATTQHHLARLLVEKQLEIATHIAELQRFSTQLSEVQTRLATEPALGQCAADLECCAPTLLDAAVPVMLGANREHRRGAR